MLFTINRNQSQDQDGVFKAIWGKEKLIEQKICIIINNNDNGNDNNINNNNNNNYNTVKFRK